jgi:uncharacterized protein (DUF1501 family)
MEVGKSADPSVNTGWLGRHLATSTPSRANASLRAIGFADGLVDTLKGAPSTLPIPDPSNYGVAGSGSTRLARQAWFQQEYQDSPEPVKSAALDALQTINLLRAINFASYVPANGAVYPNSGLARGLRSTAALIKADLGLEAVHLDVGGWDTHTQQDPIAGSMAQTMTGLAGALGAFWQDMIAGPQPQTITVVAMSEFGRNARENGGRGTDHGRGGAMFVMGHGINGGRVVAPNWPGLDKANLADGQDLKVVVDYRDILAELVQRRLGNNNLNVIFPGYAPVIRGVTK